MSATLEVLVYPCRCGTVLRQSGTCHKCGSRVYESAFREFSSLPLKIQEAYHMARRAIPHGRVTPESARILALLNSFPCLRLKRVTQWDALALQQESRAWSTGERLAVDFVLSVWNPVDFPAPAIHEMLDKWDEGNREAFLAWARAPWWP